MDLMFNKKTMNLFLAQIYNKKIAIVIFIIIGFFILSREIISFKVEEKREEVVIKNDLDSDNDGLPDNLEKILGTDMNNFDTDRDGYKDKEEIKNGYSPLLAFSEKYNQDELGKIKTNIKNFNLEIYEDIFSEKKTEKINNFENTVSVAPSLPVFVPSATPSESILPAVSSVPAIIKEKNINKDWTYIIYTPANFDRNKEHILVLVLSGVNSEASESINYWRSEADKYDFIVVALKPYEKKFPSGNIVISYPWDEASDFAISVLQDIKKEYIIDEKNIFLAGYSTGATTAYIVALDNKINFKGVIAIGGYLPLEAGIAGKLIFSKDLNFYIVHGENDTNIKVNIAQEKTLLQYGAKIDFVTLPSVATNEYPFSEQENIVKWVKELIDL